MQNSSKNQENLVGTVRSSHIQGILGALLPCHCGKEWDDNTIAVVVMQTTMTHAMGSKNGNSKLAAAKNMGRLSFLPFLLENYTHLSISVFKIFAILLTPLFSTPLYISVLAIYCSTYHTVQ